MAGDWVKMRSNLDTHPKVVSVAMALNTTELHVVGMLWKVWTWADQHSLNGNAISVTESFLDRITGVTGFAAELRRIEWLEGKEGELSFPRFTEHNGKTAKARSETTVRVNKHREEVKRKCNTKPVTKSLPEKRREEKNKEDKEPPTPKGDGRKQNDPVELPANLQTPDFLAAWDRWQQHRREKKSPLTPTSTRQQLKQMTAWGPARSIEAIDNSILNGWTGLFEPKDSTDAKHNGRSREQTRYASSIDALARFAAAEDDPEGLCESPSPPVRLEENNGLH